MTVSRIISDETLSRIIDIESAGRPDAKAKTSSATGLAQFISSTWLETLQEHRPELFNGPPYDDELALRKQPRLAIALLARLTEDNAAALGRGFTDGGLYLAHFAGVTTARKLMRATADAPASSVFSPKAIAANRSILEDKTCGEVRAWAARKMARARTDWVDIYWSTPLPKPRPPIEDELIQPESEPEPELEPERADDPVEDRPAPPPAKPTLWHRVKTWLGWGTGTGGGLGILGYLTDMRAVMVLAIAAVLLVLIGFSIALYLFGKERVRDFIARQVNRCFP